MSDTLVSIRIPKRLADRMRELVTENDYIDLSELMRSIVRQKSFKYLHAVDRAKPDIKEREELLKTLRRLLEVDP